MTRVFLSFAGGVFYLAAMPGWFVGVEEREGDGEPFAEKFPRVVAELEALLDTGDHLASAVRGTLRGVVADVRA